jgi:hypothetical protein
MLAAAALAAAGCAKKTKQQAAATSAKASEEHAGGDYISLGAPLIRGKERQRDQNELRQIAYFYQLYVNDRGRPPANWPEFKKYIERDAARETQAIDEGHYVVVWNATLASNRVLAYEKNVDLNGNQLVVMGDASVHLVKASKLKEMLKGE